MLHALVTGTSRGIGAAIAAALRERGARVIGHATRHEDEHTIAADFTESFAPQLLWQEARERLDGRIDVLVNNAGTFAKNPIALNDLHWLDGSIGFPTFRDLWANRFNLKGVNLCSTLFATVC